MYSRLERVNFFLVTYKFVGFVEVSHRRSAKNNVEAAVAEKGYFISNYI